MRISEGDGFELSNGRTVRVGSVLDSYVAYDVDEQVGHEPTTYVRYSHWWIEDRIVAPMMDEVSEFVSKIEHRVPDDELAESQEPAKRRS